MKRILSLFTCLLIVYTGFTQSISVNPSQLNFGTVNETDTDSLSVTISNNSTSTLTLTGYRFYTTYGTAAFSCQQGNIIIAPGNSATLYVRFHPRHNIFHNSELLILNDGHRGALRVDLLGQGHYSNPYYNTSENLAQETLKQELKSITGNGYVNLIYGPARDSMFMIIDNEKVNGQGATQNTIECVYTGRQAVGYVDRTDCQSSFSFNTEHTFPQGFFSSLEPMRSDLHHLFPTDDLANNTRGSLPFGIVSNPTWSQGGSKANSTTFEPRDAHKGKASRAMLYFLVRYQNYSSFVSAADETILEQWHNQFPPDAIEQDRNDAIHISQNNRNPFVDYPQFTERINSFISTATAPVNYSLDYENDSILLGNVNPLAPEFYRYWIVNNGNQPVNFSNFNLIPANTFSFANGSGTAFTLQPGEASAVDLISIAQGAGMIQGTLSFTRTFSSAAQVSVPVIANLSATGIAAVQQDNFRIFPNPFSDHICSEGVAVTTSEITDMSGRSLVKSYGSCFDNLDLSAGTYLLKINSGNRERTAVIVRY